jgi:site-specific recombinase XerD
MGPGRGEPARTVVTGPLAPYARGWRAELAARGYAPHSVTAHAQLMAHLSGWLAATGRGVDALTGEVVREYTLARRAAGYRNRATERALAPLLGYLRGLRAVPPLAVPVPSTPAEVVAGEFCDYLASERGLAAGTVHHHRRFAWLFLAELGITGEADLAGLTAAAVTSFAVSQAQRRRPGDMRSLVSALRSLLRFLHLTGRLAQPLAAAVPSVPGWRPGSLPRGVSAGQVAAMLASCDRDSAVGRRDYAILLLLTRLGLRAGEVIDTAVVYKLRNLLVLPYEQVSSLLQFLWCQLFGPCGDFVDRVEIVWRSRGDRVSNPPVLLTIERGRGKRIK